MITQLESLQVRVVVQLLEAAATKTRSKDTNSNSNTERAAGASQRFRKGDRVRIMNKVKKPAMWTSKVAWNEGAASKATVKHIYMSKAHFVTDNGIKTWQTVNNLEKIHQQP